MRSLSTEDLVWSSANKILRHLEVESRVDHTRPFCRNSYQYLWDQVIRSSKTTHQFTNFMKLQIGFVIFIFIFYFSDSYTESSFSAMQIF